MTTLLTNRYNIDPIIAEAVANDPYEKGGADFSVSELIAPPQVTWLKQEHDLEEDVSERMWALLGSTVHVVLERAAPTNVLTEERLIAEVNGVTIGGKPDLWREPAELVDWKVTSVWSFLLDDKDEWAAQGNAYAALYRRHGFPVESFTIKAILRDHMKSKVYDEGYPPIPFMEKRVPLWPADEAERYLAERVVLHQSARNGFYDECTPAERWERPTTFAVHKRGVQKARRVLPSIEAAEAWIEQNAKPLEARFMTIEERPGESRKCKSYCPVRAVCDQARRLGVEID